MAVQNDIFYAKDSGPLPSGITFGVELEFLVVAKDALDEYEAVLSAPGSGLLPVHAMLQTIYDTIKKSRHGHEVPIHQPRYFTDCDYSKWQIKMDESVRLTRRERHLIDVAQDDVFDFELVSRVYNVDQDGWECEIQTVINALLSLNSEKLQVMVNSKCGLHVHVGMGSRGLSLPLQRKTMLLVSALEQRLDALHSASRFYDKPMKWQAHPWDPEDIVQHLYNPGPSTWWNMREQTRQEGLHFIRASSTSRFLAEVMGSEDRRKHCAYNLCNIHDTRPGHRAVGRPAVEHSSSAPGGPVVYEPQSIQTIEFRQHRGSLCFEEIRAWILLTTQLVRHANADSWENVEALVEELVSTPYHYLQIPTVLHELGLDSRTIEFYRRKVGLGGFRSECELPQHTSRPFGRLMAYVNEKREWDNSHQVVEACIYERDMRGIYGRHNPEPFRGWYWAYHTRNSNEGKRDALTLGKVFDDWARIHKRLATALVLQRAGPISNDVMYCNVVIHHLTVRQGI